jgi:hypothetical protein
MRFVKMSVVCPVACFGGNLLLVVRHGAADGHG